MGEKSEEETCDGEEKFWGQLSVRLLHSTQVEVIEAMRWIGEPVSPSQLVKVFMDGIEPVEPKVRNRTLASIAYHTKRLVNFDILRFHSNRQVRGVIETFYVFDWKPQG